MNAKGRILCSSSRVVAATLCIVAVAMCMTAATAHAQPAARKAVNRGFKRAAPKAALGGVTREARDRQQFDLSNELEREIPRGAINNPVKVELTAKD